MRDLGQRARFVALLAVGSVLLVGGLILGETRHFLILGASNTAESLDTILSTSTAGAALHVAQDGAGVALQGTSNAQNGVAGRFSSFLGTGIDAIAGDGAGVALSAANQSPTTGTGAAIKAQGQFNDGLVAESWVRSAIVASATGSQPAVVANGQNVTALRAEGPGGTDLADCEQIYCGGTESTGANGLIAGTATPAGAAVYATDRTADGNGFGLVSDGEVVVDGSLSVTGGCLGCGSLILGRNATDLVLRPGDALTLLGIDVAPDGSTIFAVGPAVTGGPVLGLAERELLFTSNPGGDTTMAGGWRFGALDVPGRATLRIVTSGVFTLGGALDGIEPGTRLVVGDAPGRLVPTTDADAPAVATFLGARPDGLAVLLVDPD
jgi:hypothetical protein